MNWFGELVRFGNGVPEGKISGAQPKGIGIEPLKGALRWH